MKSYTVSNNPYGELHIINHENGDIEITKIEYNKKGKLIDKGVVLVSKESFKHIKKHSQNTRKVTK